MDEERERKRARLHDNMTIKITINSCKGVKVRQGLLASASGYCNYMLCMVKVFFLF